MKFSLLISVLLIIGLSSCDIRNKPATDHDYDEPVNTKKGIAISVSEHNTDNPEKSSIHTKLDTTLLFRTWVIDPKGPHADFDFSSKSFYVVDYDGDGNRPYTLKNNKLSIEYEDYIEEAEILYVSKDTLKIIWKGTDVPLNYVIWKG